MKIRTIIIDDEQPAIDLIIKYLESNETIEILTVCRDGFSGLKACTEYKPDLIFLDVQMPRINGFELLEVLEPVPYVIFTTAFDEYALKAFEANAVDYLLKPFGRDRFFEAVEKVFKRMHFNSDNTTEINSLMLSRQNMNEQLNRIVVKTGSNIHVISIEEIMYLEADGDYVHIYTENNRFLKENTLKYYETHLDSEQFIRIHRSRILNINFLDKIELYEKESYVVHLKNNKMLKTSLSGYKLLKNKLGF